MNELKNAPHIFKECPICSYQWTDRKNFLSDPEIETIGYQVHFENLKLGCFLFNHTCKGTLTIPVDMFTDLYDGPVFTEKATVSDECPGHCLHRFNIEPCRAKCECAFVREIIQVIKDWPKA